MGIEDLEYARAGAIFELSPGRKVTGEAGEVVADPAKEWKECPATSSSSSSTSSIGKNSDDAPGNSSSEGEDSVDNEAQSAYTGPLDRMDALEEVLPMRRGISKFYNGKSKSFATLAEASSSSIQDIVKPENAYTRKRRNLSAFHQICEKHRSSGGIAKKPLSSCRSTLALAVAMNSSDSSSSISGDSTSCSTSRSPPRRPPLYPLTGTFRDSPASSPPQPKFSTWRSLSLFDFSSIN